MSARRRGTGLPGGARSDARDLLVGGHHPACTLTPPRPVLSWPLSITEELGDVRCPLSQAPPDTHSGQLHGHPVPVTSWSQGPAADAPYAGRHEDTVLSGVSVCWGRPRLGRTGESQAGVAKGPQRDRRRAGAREECLVPEPLCRPHSMEWELLRAAV